MSDLRFHRVLKFMLYAAWVTNALCIWLIVALDAKDSGDWVYLGVATAWIGLATTGGLKEIGTL